MNSKRKPAEAVITPQKQTKESFLLLDKKVNTVMINLIHSSQSALCDYSQDNKENKEICYNVLISLKTGGLRGLMYILL
jgi:hypothetical protein